MIKGHPWLPDSFYDFFRWKLPQLVPMSEYGVEMMFFEYNPFNSKTYAGIPLILL